MNKLLLIMALSLSAISCQKRNTPQPAQELQPHEDIYVGSLTYHDDDEGLFSIDTVVADTVSVRVFQNFLLVENSVTDTISIPFSSHSHSLSFRHSCVIDTVAFDTGDFKVGNRPNSATYVTGRNDSLFTGVTIHYGSGGQCYSNFKGRRL